jgi:hypothetical protein
MKEEPRTEPAYTGAVLPGSRWRQRAYSGHLEQDVTVLRVGSRSVMVVIEGVGGSKGAPGHERHKVGQKFNVVLETFLRTHTLLSQPKGYKPGDEIAQPPKKDAVETFFKRRRFAGDWLASMEGQDIRAGVTDPDMGVLPGPVYTGDVLVPDPAAEPTPPQKEEPVQTEQAEQAEQAELPPAPVGEDKGAHPTQAQIDAVFARADAEPEPEPVAPAPPAPEIDPLDALVDNARAIVAKLDTEVAGKKWERDELAERVAKLDAEIATLSTRRTRATHAVDALVATLLGISEPEQPEPEPEPEPVKAQPEITVRPSAGGTTRLAGPMGYVPQPGKISQRQWILDRFAQKGGLAIQDVVDGFVAEYGISRDRSIKNISSIMHDQMKHPKAQWPTPVRVYPGVYTVPEAGQG